MYQMHINYDSLHLLDLSIWATFDLKLQVNALYEPRKKMRIPNVCKHSLHPK